MSVRSYKRRRSQASETDSPDKLHSDKSEGLLSSPRSGRYFLRKRTQVFDYHQLHLRGENYKRELAASLARDSDTGSSTTPSPPKKRRRTAATGARHSANATVTSSRRTTYARRTPVSVTRATVAHASCIGAPQTDARRQRQESGGSEALALPMAATLTVDRRKATSNVTNAVTNGSELEAKRRVAVVSTAPTDAAAATGVLQATDRRRPAAVFGGQFTEFSSELTEKKRKTKTEKIGEIAKNEESAKSKGRRLQRVARYSGSREDPVVIDSDDFDIAANSGTQTRTAVCRRIHSGLHNSANTTNTTTDLVSDKSEKEKEKKSEAKAKAFGVSSELSSTHSSSNDSTEESSSKPSTGSSQTSEEDDDDEEDDDGDEDNDDSWNEEESSAALPKKAKVVESRVLRAPIPVTVPSSAYYGRRAQDSRSSPRPLAEATTDSALIEAQRDDAMYSCDSKGYLVFTLGLRICRRFVLRKQLGKGTFSRVFEAKDQSSGQRVAVKVIRRVYKYQVAAQTELRVLRALQSHGGNAACVRLLEDLTYKGHKVFVFPLLGRSLYGYLVDNGYRPFTKMHVRHLLRQILEGVCFVHSLGIVITDLKPENIVLVDDGSDRRRLEDGSVYHVPKSAKIKLIDFGSAVFHKAGGHSHLIQTRHYRAPEVVLSQRWDATADLWSLGCILIELMYGKMLFNTHDSIDHFGQMLRCVGPCPRQLLSGCTPQVSAEFFVKDKHKKLSLALWKATRSPVQCKPLANYFRAKDEDHNVRNLYLLAKALLRWTPAARISCKDALRHPYFLDHV